MARDTGFPDADAENDFTRMRRHAEMSRLMAWFTRQPADVNTVLPFDEVVAALGRIGDTYLGLQQVEVESIVGSVDRTKDFDRYFRPTSSRIRERWQRLAAAQRRGESVPPVRLYRIGSMHFVLDGHHRVSIAIARHLHTIDAYVTEIHTRISPEGINAASDLIMKDHRRLFLSRVPLAGAQADAIRFSDPFDYAELSENVEAWGFRLGQEIGEFLSRPEVARRWFGEEFLPVVRMARRADIRPDLTSDAELYLWLACERYRLVRKHIWDDDILRELHDQGRRRRR
ncbi:MULTISPECIES: chromosome partitioning protein ParB [Gordonia]|uniref:Chromosome partitioning protein ParB n=1 Tax=Gordonia hankookensis TaxID=589403 RepID=A0ABR7WDK1_9ACTN|nr:MULTISPECIES: chromosome partitioning protein ParB [Gordonia]MBD1320854.1 chromosome partitioning protein ParB [Gordonia hankookensis]NDZ96433.1 chromosome partitioning protein ParB [Streptomyces sp. SID11726]NEB24862.1 chromosome partitioning protein ParB [Streptomyces sp. SID6673]WAC54871.1 chromosome partitioning protein ParB [Gordonia sp. SL306]